MSARILPRLIIDVAAAGWVVALTFSANRARQPAALNQPFERGGA